MCRLATGIRSEKRVVRLFVIVAAAAAVVVVVVVIIVVVKQLCVA
jgi:hypothetical protein